MNNKIRNILSVIIIGGVLVTGAFALNSKYDFLHKTEKTSPVYMPIQTDISSQPVSSTKDKEIINRSERQEVSTTTSQSYSDIKKQTGEKKVITEGISYSINDVEVLKSVSADVVKKIDFESEKFDGNKLIAGCTYVSFDITLKNIGKKYKAGTLNSMYLSTFDEYGSEVQSSEMCYYDKGDVGRAYFHYTLNPGKALNCNVGFVLEDSLFESMPIKLVINPTGTYPLGDDARYIPLKLY